MSQLLTGLVIGLTAIVGMSLVFVAPAQVSFVLFAAVQFIHPAVSIAGVNVANLIVIGFSLGLARKIFQGPARGLEWVVAALLILQLATLSWSPDSTLGVNRIFQTLTFAIALIYADSLEVKPVSVLAWLSPLFVAQGLATIAFRLNPALESSYFQSRLGTALLGNAAFGLVNGSVINNVTDPLKSGGLLFVNANVNSMALGTISLACIWAALTSENRRLRISLASIGWLLFICQFFAGSKTGFILGAVALLLLMVAGPLSRARHKALWALVCILVLLLGVVAFYGLSGDESASSSQADVTWQIRLTIWSAALSILRQSAFLGLGFGGWEVAFSPIAPRLGLDQVYPPHNYFLASWGESGLIGLGLTAAIAVITATAAAGYVRTASSYAVWIRMAGAIAVFWPLIHGLADNTQVYGVPQTAAVQALLLVMMLRGRISWPGASATDFPRVPERLPLSMRRWPEP